MNVFSMYGYLRAPENVELCRGLVRGVEDLDITTQKDQGRPGQNRGFCFLEMYNQAVAEEAMAILVAPGVQLCGMCASSLIMDRGSQTLFKQVATGSMTTIDTGTHIQKNTAPVYLCTQKLWYNTHSSDYPHLHATPIEPSIS